ncbi:hypothetical protein EsDP_00004002 [Epichloe bromicola]|uniref:Calcineurin-like phosphoesterase domain-containing protein n=1 Tax=Epichloe bromicola TaxID=79588 RepID=A0ABQ0CQE5_9HYPO
MSHRHVFAASVFFAATLITILTCLPHLPVTPWPSRAAATQGQSIDTTPMSYGRNRRPKMDDLTLTSSIPQTYLPTTHNERRLIVIGDIHGMNTELGHLLDEARYDSSHDHIVTLGDMVNKGPESKGVLARLMAMNASAVRGNHEDHLLLALKEYNSRAAPNQDNDDPPSVIEMRPRNRKILKVAKTLSPEQVDWLSGLPVILKAKSLQLYFVHGGLVPGVRLAKQDPWAVMNMRTLVYPSEELRRNAESASDSNSDSDSLLENERDVGSGQEEEDEADDVGHDDVDASKVVAIPIDGHSGEKWTKAWDRYMKHRAKSARRTVMYGHDARRGFTEGKHTVGLDSGCVRGGSLTGLIVRSDAKHGFRYTRIQVPCKHFLRKDD